MTVIQRIGLEVGGALFLIVAALVWWQIHNVHEQKLGAADCIQQTTVTKAQAVITNTDDERMQADLLKQKVTDYDEKLRALSATNDALVERLRNAVRPGVVSHPRCATGQAPADRGLSQSQEPTRPSPTGDVTESFRAVLAACDADHARVDALNGAYNDWRQRMIEREARHTQ